MPAAVPFTILIPARIASTRLPRKALADLDGKPLIVRVAEQAARCGATRVVVATDDAAILAAVREAGHDAIMTAPNHPSGTDRLAEAAKLLGLPDDTIVVNVQGDEPDLPPALVQAVAQCLAAAPDCPMATAAHPIHSRAEWLNPNVVKVLPDGTGRALCFTRAPVPLVRDGLDDSDPGIPAALLAARLPLRHIGLYAYRAGFLTRYASLAPSPLEDIEKLEQLRVLHHGYSIALTIADQPPPPGIDTPDDLQAARKRRIGQRHQA